MSQKCLITILIELNYEDEIIPIGKVQRVFKELCKNMYVYEFK